MLNNPHTHGSQVPTAVFFIIQHSSLPSEMGEAAGAELRSEAVRGAPRPTCDNVRLDMSAPGSRRDDVIPICEGDTCVCNHTHSPMRAVQQSRDSATLRPVQTCQSKSLAGREAKKTKTKNACGPLSLSSYSFSDHKR